jgi:hypothetical protein
MKSAADLEPALQAAAAEPGMHSAKLAARLVAMFHGRMVTHG